MSETFEEYLKKTQALIDSVNLNKKKNLDNEYALLTTQQDEQAEKQARDAYTDYANYINPYGTIAESLNQRGLYDSSLAESNKTRAYGAYQNRVASAYDTNEANKTNLNIKRLSEENEADLKLLTDNIALAEQGLADYYKQRQWDYDLYRDELEDERYDKQWAYKTSTAVSPSKTYKSYSGKASNSKSSNNTKTENSKEASDTPINGFLDAASGGLSGEKVIIANEPKRDKIKIRTIMGIISQVAGQRMVRTSEGLAPYLELITQYGGNEADIADAKRLWEEK